MAESYSTQNNLFLVSLIHLAHFTFNNNLYQNNLSISITMLEELMMEMLLFPLLLLLPSSVEMAQENFREGFGWDDR